MLDKSLTATVGGQERELTVEEVLQQQTLKDALAGKRMAIRKVLKMIEKREAVLAKRNGPPSRTIQREVHHCASNANEAMSILGIAEPDPTHPNRWKVNAWATQAALGRPGRRKFSKRDVESIKFFTDDPDKIRWPRGRIE